MNRFGGRRDLRPPIRCLLRDGPRDRGTLQFPFRVDNNTRIILEIDPNPILTTPKLTLADDNRGSNLSTELRLPVTADGDQDHVSNRGLRETVEMPFPILHSDDVQGLRARVVCAVDDRPHREPAGDAELAAKPASPSTLRCHSLTRPSPFSPQIRFEFVRAERGV